MTQEQRSAAQRSIRSEALARLEKEGGVAARVKMQRRLISEVMAETIFQAAVDAGLLLLDEDREGFVRAVLPVLETGRPSINRDKDGQVTATWVWDE
jgi:hypothetical protein